jgi:CDP-glucose 4,6-dehydratase
MKETFGSTFDGLTVLVTGHTGFKGSWLSIWLRELGARVIGYSLEPPTVPSNFALSGLDDRVIDVRRDVRDLQHLEQTIVQHQPRVVFHLAAQPLVLPSYREPKETFDVNVGGTVNVLEAVRTTRAVKAVVCVTTDKVYRNREWLWGYRENDELGGHDPYSTSKAMAELAIASYRQSFFPVDNYAEHGVAVASARAGNVIGGGDWGAHRLVPDCVRALMEGQPIHLRNPGYVRPWQILLEPLSGYLWLAAKLLGKDGNRFAEAWNFGPEEHRGVTTEELVNEVIALWGSGSYTTGTTQTEVETALLRLNWDKAAHRLDWHSVYTWREALSETIDWYRQYAESAANGDMYDVCVAQIQRYADRASELGLAWAQHEPRDL